jgi:hypothetical protein
MHKSAICPECDTEIGFPELPVIDQRALCSRCGSDLIVIRLNPTVLDWAFVEPLSRPGRSDFIDVRLPHPWDEN